MKTIEFYNTGEDFSGLHHAESWCRLNGYSMGSMQQSRPIGVVKGDAYISKWMNMTTEEKEDLDGTIESMDFRMGTVFLHLKEEKK